MTNAWIANQLVTLYGKDAQITNFVDNIEWTIIPIVNVDGYVYTWTTDRMWRKNRYVLILLNLVVARVRLADVSVCAALSSRVVQPHQQGELGWLRWCRHQPQLGVPLERGRFQLQHLR
jgi:hypothetical protein